MAMFKFLGGQDKPPKLPDVILPGETPEARKLRIEDYMRALKEGKVVHFMNPEEREKMIIDVMGLQGVSREEAEQQVDFSMDTAPANKSLDKEINTFDREEAERIRVGNQQKARSRALGKDPRGNQPGLGA